MNSASAYKRLGRRKAFTLSVVSAAAYIQTEDNMCVDAKFAFGSVAMTPIRVNEVEDMIKGHELSEENILAASVAVMEYVKPITDVRGTEEYRRDMCPVLMRRAIQTSMERMR
jgi:carbon-monoxide dehydrogenase medium subunit